MILSCAFAVPSAVAQTAVEHRTGFLECGGTHVRARAECYDKSPYCRTETLSFARRNGRVIVPLHAHYTPLPADAKSSALDYRAESWACVPGKFGGQYVVVVMSRANGAACSDCEYSRLYDLNGRFIAADVDFDPRGHARANAAGREMMNDVLGGPRRHAFSAVYRP